MPSGHEKGHLFWVPSRESERVVTALLGGGDGAGEFALVAVGLILVDLAALGCLVDDGDGVGGECREPGFVEAAFHDRGADLLELILDGSFDAAILLSAADGLAGAFGSGLGIGHGGSEKGSGR